MLASGLETNLNLRASCDQNKKIPTHKARSKKVSQVSDFNIKVMSESFFTFFSQTMAFTAILFEFQYLHKIVKIGTFMEYLIEKEAPKFPNCKKSYEALNLNLRKGPAGSG